VNKKCLNLTEVLFVFQLTGSHERKAITEWIRDKDLDEDIYAELPKLATGHPHIWSPGWLQVSRVIRILEKSTFDASRTPEVGRRADVKELAPIDLEKLRRDMAATIERAKQEDPRELRRQVADLKSQLAKTKTLAPVPVATKIEVPVVRKGELSRLEKMVERLDAIRDRMAQAQQVVVSEVGLLREAIAKVGRPIMPERGPGISQHQTVGTAPPRKVETPAPVRSRPTLGISEDLTGPERRILEALAWMESIGQVDVDPVATAFLSGYTYGGGAFNNPRGRLNVRRLIQYRGGGRLALTEAGRNMIDIPQVPLTTEELHRRVLERLPGPERKILRVLLEAYPKAVNNEELAERAGYAVGGGAFANPRGRLRSLGLVEYQGKGMVVARPLLFLER
jgi:hypothetical protein